MRSIHTFLTGFVLFSSLSFFLVSCSNPSSDLPDSLPNVVFINVDDWGWQDYGKKNPQWFNTPHIDALSQQSLVFINAYAGAANCAPSRACLLSGMNTPRHGIYTVSPSDRGNERTRRIIPIVNTKHLQDSVILIPELFKMKGYVTANMGKWHVSKDPLTQGVDKNIAGGPNGNPGKNGYFSPYNVPNLEDGPEGEYLTDRITNEAISFIRENKGNRFFLYLPYYAVHTPLLPKLQVYEKDYKNNDNYLHNKQQKYAAMVETLDQNVGSILQELENSQLAENTIVILTSDNGGIAAISPQAPARGGKGSYFQGGIKVPLMIRWKGVTNASVTEVPTVNLDFFPTFSNLLNVSVDQPTDGISLLNLIKGGEEKNKFINRSIFWHFPIYLQAYDGRLDEARDPLFRTRPGSLIVKGGYALHHYFENDEVVLYDLNNDPGEHHDLSNEFSNLSDSLYRELEEWRKINNALVPEKINPEYDPIFELDKIQQKTGT